MNLYFRDKDASIVGWLLVIGLVAQQLMYWGMAWSSPGQVPIEMEVAAVHSYQFELDVNDAAWHEWTLLPGIGEKLAQRIVEFRNRQKGIRDLAEIKQVEGIGPKKFQAMRKYLHLGETGLMNTIKPMESR